MKGKTIEEFSADTQKDKITKKFLTIFHPLEHQYKMYIHQCQYKAYKDNSNYVKAQDAAQECMKGYLVMQRHVTAELIKYEIEYQDCKVEAFKAIKQGKHTLDPELQKCLALYQRNLPKSKNQILKLYKGYLLNYTNNPHVK
jgi:hypothetical protein